MVYIGDSKKAYNRYLKKFRCNENTLGGKQLVYIDSDIEVIQKEGYYEFAHYKFYYFHCIGWYFKRLNEDKQKVRHYTIVILMLLTFLFTLLTYLKMK